MSIKLKNAPKILGLDISTKTFFSFKSKKEYNNNHICKCCLGKVKTAAGYVWKYEKN